MMSTTDAANKPLQIRSVFNINSAFCAIKTNGVLGMDNRDSALAGRGFGTSSTNAMLVLANGENEISLEIGALGWFSEAKLSDEDRKKFSPGAGCKLELTAFKGMESKVLSRIEVGINSSGIPVVRPDEERVSTTPQDVTVRKIVAPQTEKGHLPDDYVIKNYYPDGMALYQFTRKVYLRGLPDWKWVKATPFTGTPEQVQALKRAYLDLWQLFASKKSSAVRSYLNESLQAWSLTTGDSVDEIYNDRNFVQNFKNPGFEMIPINWADYQLEVMNNGRMVRFVNKSVLSVSPISYYIALDNGWKRLMYYSPVYSLINGRFVPVI